MKTVEVKITGNSLLAYVSFYDAEILDRLSEIEEGEYDFLDFSAEHKKFEVFLGRGFGNEGDLSLSVLVDGEEVLETEVIFADYGDQPTEEIKALFLDEHDVEYDDSLSAKSSGIHDADKYFFGQVNRYTYCSLETAQCDEAYDSISIEVDDDFKLSDLNIQVVMVDSGADGAISQLIYGETGLEGQVIGVEYKGRLYEFMGGNDKGGSNDIFWYKREKTLWGAADELVDRIEELESY